MPDLRMALLAEHARAEAGLAHAIGIGMDTVSTSQVPAVCNLAVLLRMAFTRAECDRLHQIDLVFADTDGAELLKATATLRPEWKDGLPTGWLTSSMMALNMGVNIPAYGEYVVEILINDSSASSLQFRVIPIEDGR